MVVPASAGLFFASQSPPEGGTTNYQWRHSQPALDLAAGGRELSMGLGKGITFVCYDPELRRDSVQHAVAHLRATLFDPV